ncbi:MAG TPA: DMT family transporter [Actinomycetospora sp.]|jgi:hypothetical protein|uniref:DMT family transporter n=1 Tax=Actinomycetospora sp. TaxID=1872135 RepID=UPI002F3F097C
MLLAVVAACLNAAGDLLQRGSTRKEGDPGSGSVSLLWRLARRPGWLLGVGASVTGLGVHVVALSIGQLAAVQPLLVLELPVAVVASSSWFGVRLSRQDWVAVALLAVGLAAFVFGLSPRGGRPTGVSGGTWAAGLAVLLGLVVVLAGVGWRCRQDLRAALLGVAAGVGYGATAVLFSTAGASAAHGLAALLGTWEAYGAAAVGLASFYLLQNSLSAGLLVATEPGLTLANPLVAVTWGLAVFGEQARTGPWLVVSITGGMLLVAGVVLLGRSPVLSDGRSSDDEGPPGEGRGTPRRPAMAEEEPRAVADPS